MEDDVVIHIHTTGRTIFQSTSPVWRTTAEIDIVLFALSISIHVPRVEDDLIDPDTDEDADISIHVPRVEDDI